MIGTAETAVPPSTLESSGRTRPPPRAVHRRLCRNGTSGLASVLLEKAPTRVEPIRAALTAPCARGRATDVEHDSRTRSHARSAPVAAATLITTPTTAGSAAGGACRFAPTR